MGLGGGLRRVLRFPPPHTTSHELGTFGLNVTKSIIPNPNPVEGVKKSRYHAGIHENDVLNVNPD